MTRPPERRVVTNYTAEHKSHQAQLQAIADDLLKHMRANLNDPRMFKTYAESFAIVSKLLSDELPTETKRNEQPVDTSEFDE